MNKLKIPSLCLLFFLLFSAEKCENKTTDPNTTTEQPANIEVIEATAMSWVAGIKDGGSGTEYNFTVVVGTNKPLSISAVSINGEKRAHTVSKQGSAVSNTELQIAQHDTLNVHVSTETNREKASALLEYKMDGLAYQLTIDQIEVLETQNRP